ncbi:putative ascorbate-specific transmembrane electron transporter 1 [Silene latifolia]|uniref:putative ascorbate-specific transmembrane electron transporter 1 n=1 Tax=Silene latifolia TaxID=37657 RepID=UPI003D77E1FD
MKGNQQALVSPVVAFAHVLVVVVTALVLVWLLHFREGLAFNTHIKPKIFNIHPLLMIVGFILLGGEAILAYKTVPGARKIQKRTHLTLHLVALLTGLIGTFAVFKYHQDLSIPHFYTLHSWVGLITIILYGLQWLYSIFTFAFPHTKSSTRKKVAPWHIFGGIIIFILGICAALTGLVEKFTFSKLQREQEALVMNFTGLMIVLFSITVGAGVLLPRIN